jgi:hypothetical protein
VFVKQIIELFRGNVAAVIEKVLQFVEVALGSMVWIFVDSECTDIEEGALEESGTSQFLSGFEMLAMR